MYVLRQWVNMFSHHFSSYFVKTLSIKGDNQRYLPSCWVHNIFHGNGHEKESASGSADTDLRVRRLLIGQYSV